MQNGLPRPRTQVLSIGFFLSLGLMAQVPDLPANDPTARKLASEHSAVEEIAHHRVILLLGRGKGEASLEKHLPKEFSVVTSRGELVVLDTEGEVSDEMLQRLRVLPGVEAVQRDSGMTIQDEDEHASGAPSSSRKTEEGNDDVDPSSREGKNCLGLVCKDGRSRFWAQDSVHADLMKQYVKNWLGGRKSAAEVVVVDSGLDKNQQKHLDSVGGFSVHKALEEKEEAEHPITLKKIYYAIGDPNKDPGGHGTMVCSTIFGKGKLGVGEGLHGSLYRVTQEGDTGSTLSSVLDIAVYRACLEHSDADGITIINESWGGRTEEAGFETERDLEMKRKFTELLADNGCLLVKAAGNATFRKQYKGNPEDLSLAAGAIDSTRQLAQFSSTGAVNAPGHNVYVLESTTASSPAEPEQRCDGKDSNRASPRRFVNGTSFASPITAAIAGMLTRILKTVPAFGWLERRDRVQLIIRMIKASVQDGSIDGLRAAAIATRWAAGSDRHRALGPDEPQAISTLKNLLIDIPDKVCREKTSLCSKLKDCKEVVQCFDLGRKRQALCSPLPAAELDDLAETAFLNNHREHGNAMTLALIGQRGVDKAKVIERSLAHNIEGIRAGSTDYDKIYGSSLPLNYIRAMVVPYFHACAESGGCDEKRIEKLLGAVLHSSELEKSISKGFDPAKGEDRASGDTLQAVNYLFASVEKILGRARTEAIVEGYADALIKKLAENSTADGVRKYTYSWNVISPTVNLARILDGLAKSPGTRQSLKGAIARSEKKLVDRMMKMNERFAVKTQRSSLPDELYPTRPVFDPLVERHQKLIERAIQKHRISALSPVQVDYLLRKLGDKNSPWAGQKQEVLLEILEAISKNEGWMLDNDLEFFDRTMAELNQMAKSSANEEKKVREGVRGILSGASNSRLLAYVATGWARNHIFTSESLRTLSFGDIYDARHNGMTFRNSKCLDQALIDRICDRLVLAFLRADPESFKLEALIGNRETFSALFQNMYDRRAEPLRAVEPLALGKPYLTRLEPHQVKPAPAPEKMRQTFETMSEVDWERGSYPNGAGEDTAKSAPLGYASLTSSADGSGKTDGKRISTLGYSSLLSSGSGLPMKRAGVERPIVYKNRNELFNPLAEKIILADMALGKERDQEGQRLIALRGGEGRGFLSELFSPPTGADRKPADAYLEALPRNGSWRKAAGLYLKQYQADPYSTISGDVIALKGFLKTLSP